jgi:small-conductance mechanosensitive channel
LLGALGIGGIAVALALQPTLLNLFSGLMLHAQRPIRLGDEVVTGDIRGTVMDISSRAVVIRTYSGETVYVPNSVVLDREIVNLVKEGCRRTTIVVGVSYQTDLRRAAGVLRDAVATTTGVLADPGPRVLATEFADSSVNFDVDFWHRPDEAAKRRVRSEVAKNIHEALREADIVIPFPQRTLWFADLQRSADVSNQVD